MEKIFHYNKEDISKIQKIEIVKNWWITHSLLKSLNKELSEVKEIENFYKKNLSENTKKLLSEISTELEKQLPENRKKIKNQKILYETDTFDLSFLKNKSDNLKDISKNIPDYKKDIEKENSISCKMSDSEWDLSHIYCFNKKNHTKEEVIKLQKALYYFWNYRTNYWYNFNPDWVFWAMTEEALDEYIRRNPERSLIIDEFNIKDKNNKNKVIEIQKELKRLKYYSWKIDWIYWRDTEKSFKKYKKIHPTVEIIY